MSKFKKVRATNRSLSIRKLLCGVGINDAWYMPNRRVNGIQFVCPAYETWKHMIYRCYSEKELAKCPTYTECTVCDDWLIFSNFAKWFECNFISGCELDKDIKIKGNKTYSPHTCLFVTHSVNNLLVDSKASRGRHPIGVSFHNKSGKFVAQVGADGKRKHLGLFVASGDAHKAYKIAKNEQIRNTMKEHHSIEKYLEQHLHSI